MSKQLGIVNTCRKCPHSAYSVGGSYICTKMQGANSLPNWYAGGAIPKWCPLPDAQEAQPEIAPTPKDGVLGTDGGQHG